MIDYDYRDRYFETLDKLAEAREERDTLFKALKETQKQLDMARAIVEMYRRDKHEGDEDDD